jgi:hypothetical protein
MGIDLVKIGQILKQKREEKGLGLEDLTKVLCLRKSLISALESGDWTSLPHEVYVKGYIKEYATFLKVCDEVAAVLLETKNEEPVSILKPAKPLQDKAVTRTPKAFETSRKGFSKTLLIYPAILVLIVTFFLMEREQRSSDSMTPKAGNSGVSTNAVNTNSDQPIVQEIAEGKRLMITCHERAWVSVVIDGAEKKEFMLSPQEIIMLTARERFDILVGNSGGVKIFLNGKNTEFTGKNGEVKRLKLS